MVIRAVRAVLQDEPYRSGFSFEVIGWETPKGKEAQANYCFGRERHGFVVLDDGGAVVACRPGHFYGAPEIRSDLDRILAR